MVLAVNVGNTTILIGGMEEDRVCFTASISTQKAATADEYATSIGQILLLHHQEIAKIEGAIVSSVVPSLTKTVKEGIARLCSCAVVEVSVGMKTGLNIKTGQGGNLGADFVCNAVAALAEYQLPCVIVSLGTATTFAALDKQGRFVGTSITAGVQTSLDALRECAVRLPQIGLETPEEIIGTNTVNAIQSGLIYGTASMIDGMANRYQRILGDNVTFILTGRYASLLAPFLETKLTQDDYLLLKGLSRIYQKNK